MTWATDKPITELPQYMALAVLSLGAAGATAVLYPFHDEYFQPIFGSLNPLLAVGVVTIMGAASLYFLQSRGWFAIYSKRETFKGTRLPTTLATLFAIPAILVDFRFGIPLELNVPLLASLLFYPSIGYVAELAFHTIPLAILLALSRPLSNKF